MSKSRPMKGTVSFDDDNFDMPVKAPKVKAPNVETPGTVKVLSLRTGSVILRSGETLSYRQTAAMPIAEAEALVASEPSLFQFV